MQKDTFNLKTIFRSFLNAFNIERGFIPTVRDLLIRPKQVVDYYIEGNRVKYFTPGRFFVTVLAIITAFYFVSSSHDKQKKINYISDEYSFESSLELWMDYEQLTPEEKNEWQSFTKEKKNKKGLQLMTEIRHKILSRMLEVTYDYTMLLFCLTLIFISLISRLVFYNQGYNLAKHFVIWIYCYMNLGLINTIFFSWWSYNIPTLKLFLPVILGIIYFIYVIKNIFKVNWIYTIMSSSILLIISFISVFITVMGYIIIIDPSFIDMWNELDKIMSKGPEN